MFFSILTHIKNFYFFGCLLFKFNNLVLSNNVLYGICRGNFELRIGILRCYIKTVNLFMTYRIEIVNCVWRHIMDVKK